MSQFDEDEDTDARPRGPRHATRVPDEIGEDIHRRLAALTARSKSNRTGVRSPGVSRAPTPTTGATPTAS